LRSVLFEYGTRGVTWKIVFTSLQLVAAPPFELESRAMLAPCRPLQAAPVSLGAWSSGCR